jgi:hypothetical protein
LVNLPLDVRKVALVKVHSRSDEAAAAEPGQQAQLVRLKGIGTGTFKLATEPGSPAATGGQRRASDK